MNEKLWKIQEKAQEDIKQGKGFYESIFTDELNDLDPDEQSFVIGSLQSEFSLSYRELIDLLVKERLEGEQ